LDNIKKVLVTFYSKKNKVNSDLFVIYKTGI